MLVACTTSTADGYATTGDVMMLLFRSTSTASVASTQEIDYLGRLADRASREADAICGRPLAAQVYSESLPGRGGRRLLLSRTPLVKVLRFFDSTTTCEATAFCSSDYRVDSHEAGIISRDAGYPWSADVASAESCFALGLTPSYRPGELARPWLVEYIAGYFTEGTTACFGGRTTGDETWTTGPTLPGDLIQAVATRAATYYSNPLGVAERKVGDLSVRYRAADAGAGHAADFRAALAPYRRVYL